MVDKSHCIMNMEDEDEFLDFYDFTKTYENHPLLIKDANAIKEEPQDEEEEGKEAAAGSEEEWDDCELEEEDVASGEEDESSSWVEVDPKDVEVQIDSSASAATKNPQSKAKFEERKGTGVTREEAFLGLNIKRAKILSTGEIQLGNGKILGHRQFHYIYKQKPRLPDTREAVVINKIALEYRKLKAL